jgi:hypothetical protein
MIESDFALGFVLGFFATILGLVVLFISSAIISQGGGGIR